jgi:two-component system, NtrC family, sensor kinase
MKYNILLSVILLTQITIYGQVPERLQLLEKIRGNTKDTSLVPALAKAARVERNTDTAYYFANKGLELARAMQFKSGEALSLLTISMLDDRSGNYSESLRNILNAFSLYEKESNQAGMAEARLFLQGTYYNVLGDYRKALEYSIPGEKQSLQHNLIGFLGFPGQRLAPLFSAEIAQVYILLNEPDSALIYANRAIAQRELINGSEWNFPIYLLATIQRTQGKYTESLANYRKAYHLAIQNNYAWDTIQIFAGLSTLLLNMEQPDSAIRYAGSVVQHWNKKSEYKNLYEAMDNLAQGYKAKGMPDSAVKYLELEKSVKDTLYAAGINREIQKVSFEESLKTEQLMNEQLRFKSKVQFYGFIIGALVLLAVAGLAWRSSIHQKNAKQKIESAYSVLKSTQAQLIQREKMASLGELTAGIAHEIQNPLNFVNNFSEINADLAVEIDEAIKKGNLDEVRTLASDIKSNQEKIKEHGQRADSIVKNMLQHSCSSTGSKEPTDINKLAEEYLRLAYHGFRVKDKQFNASILTDFDPELGVLSVVPQDIGRVLLNLFNNAFYTMSERKHDEGDMYKPTLTISTRRLGDKIEISVADNGTGIPDHVKAKIFQPFFTTKPTGQGTGLGLSLSYDIVTKGHGGEINVQATEDAGTTFIISLPENQSDNG